MPSLAVTLGPLRAKNPVFSASGTFGYGEEMEPFLNPGVYGGIIGKSISIKPRGGNPTPRVVETASGMLNSIGLQNPGFDAFLRDYLPRMRGYGTLLVVNLVGDTVDEYVEMARRLEEVEGGEAVDALELNISCPNCPQGGMEFGIDPKATRLLVERVRAASRKPILAKLTPNVTDIVSIARAAEDGGADVLTLTNTFVGMAIDWRKRQAILPARTGGLSGPAIKPLSLRLVWQVARGCNIPVMGIGGIMNADDVMDFLVAGARAVQIGTVQFVRPRAVLEILEDLHRFLEEEGLDSIEQVVGTIK
ncbi:MAG: dihydroorotate dehydrogenase [Planctomycetes bacterium]|nr:dihydroorotate dehydrogenase [Planctomycetota bacterium]